MAVVEGPIRCSPSTGARLSDAISSGWELRSGSGCLELMAVVEGLVRHSPSTGARLMLAMY